MPVTSSSQSSRDRGKNKMTAAEPWLNKLILTEKLNTKQTHIT
jgi:hypothetical protein